ncbi:MAG: helix-turn-helix domain-containing protein [Nanohaloarchaea archaeon]|nr:helix-turn-helix domain-containing protein [Candidatus Nanohaloarchaea archaeon]
MRFESEIVSEDILPAIRKIIADRLQKDYGYTQEEVAAKLDVTQPAVSQYLKGKRSDSEIVKKLKSDPQINLILDDAVSNAAKNKKFGSEIREIIKTSRDKGLFKERFKDAERAL